MKSFQHCEKKQTCTQENHYQVQRKFSKKIPAKDRANEVDLSK